MDTPQFPQDELILDEEGRLDADVPCLRCGYNLRGPLPEGQCPECGTAVGRSIHGDLLRYCDPQWVSRLERGMNWIIAGIVCSVVGTCAGGFSFGFAAALTGNNSALETMVFTAFVAAMSLVGLIGYWLVTSPDPSKTGEENGLTARKLARFGMTAAVVLAPIQIAADHYNQLGYLVLLVLIISLILRYRPAFKMAATEARMTWARGVPELFATRTD